MVMSLHHIQCFLFKKAIGLNKFCKLRGTAKPSFIERGES